MERASGRFELVRPLGQGGMGQVWEARDPRLPGRRVALKRLRRDLLSPDLVVRFLREAELLARVSHPGVLRVHEVGSDAEGPYLVTDLIEGTSLSRVVAEGGLPPARAVPVVLQLCEALTAVHAAGVIHRDVKPDNVLLLPDDRAVLLDFGLARELDRDSLTRTGEIMGTPAYMAPEQVQDPRGVDPRADVYALGAVLYALLTGRPPFAGSLPQVLLAVLNQGPAWPCTRAAALDAVVRRAMAREREQRYPDAPALGLALESAGPVPRRRSARAGALALGLALIGALWLARPGVAPEAERAPRANQPEQPPTSAAPTIGWLLRPGQRLTSQLEVVAHERPLDPNGGVPLHYTLRIRLKEQVLRADEQGLERQLIFTGLQLSTYLIIFDTNTTASPLRYLLHRPIRVCQDPHTGRVRSVNGLDEALRHSLDLIQTGADLGQALALFPLREEIFTAHLDNAWCALPPDGPRPGRAWQTRHTLPYWSDQVLPIECTSAWDGAELVRADGVSRPMLVSERRVLHDARLTRTQRWAEFGIARSETSLHTLETWADGGACAIDFQLTYTAQLEPGDRSR